MLIDHFAVLVAVHVNSLRDFIESRYCGDELGEWLPAFRVVPREEERQFLFETFLHFQPLEDDLSPSELYFREHKEALNENDRWRLVLAHLPIYQLMSRPEPDSFVVRDLLRNHRESLLKTGDPCTELEVGDCYLGRLVSLGGFHTFYSVHPVALGAEKGQKVAAG